MFVVGDVERVKDCSAAALINLVVNFESVVYYVGTLVLLTLV